MLNCSTACVICFLVSDDDQQGLNRQMGPSGSEPQTISKGLPSDLILQES